MGKAGRTPHQKRAKIEHERLNPLSSSSFRPIGEHDFLTALSTRAVGRIWRGGSGDGRLQRSLVAREPFDGEDGQRDGRGLHAGRHDDGSEKGQQRWQFPMLG